MIEQLSDLFTDCARAHGISAVQDHVLPCLELRDGAFARQEDLDTEAALVFLGLGLRPLLLLFRGVVGVEPEESVVEPDPGYP